MTENSLNKNIKEMIKNNLNKNILKSITPTNLRDTFINNFQDNSKNSGSSRYLCILQNCEKRLILPNPMKNFRYND